MFRFVTALNPVISPLLVHLVLRRKSSHNAAPGELECWFYSCRHQGYQDGMLMREVLQRRRLL